MVLKFYCDKCKKEISLVDMTPGIALDDPGVGSMISLKVDEKAWVALELCREYADELLKIWKEFPTMGDTEA